MNIEKKIKNLGWGINVYFLTLLLLILAGIYFQYRKKHPINNFNNLFKTPSAFSQFYSNPCQTNIAGEPDIPDGKSYIKVIIYCPDGSTTYNTLRLDGLSNKPTVGNALQKVAEINNFKIVSNLGGKIIQIGNISNQKNSGWNIYLDQKPAFLFSKLNPKSNISIKYDKN